MRQQTAYRARWVILAAALIAGAIASSQAQNDGAAGPQSRFTAIGDPSRAEAQRQTTRSGPASRSHRPMGSGTALPPEQLDEMMAFLKEHMPELHQRLDRLRSESRPASQRLIGSTWQLYNRVRNYPPEIQTAAISRHQLNVSIFQAVADYQQAPPAEKETRRTRIRELLAKQFEHDQVVKEYEVKRLTQQLANLRAELEERSKSRDRIIQERLDSVLQGPARTRPAAVAAD